MKTYNRTYLPESINYNGKILKLNARISGAMAASNTSPTSIQRELKKEGRIGVLVRVISKELKGKTDLDRRPYKPTLHIFTN